MSNLSVNFSNQPAGIGSIQDESPFPISANHSDPNVLNDAAAFDELMNAPAEDFQSKFQSLPESQKQKINERFNQYDDKLKGAVDALNDVPMQPQVDMNRLDEPGYLDKFMQESDAFLQKSGAALSKTQEAIDAGTALFDTLEGIDPALAKAPPLPEVGKQIINLMRSLGSSQEQIDRVSNAIGISV